MTNFMVPPQIVLGAGSLSELPKIAGGFTLKISRAMLVVGKTWAKETGMAQKVVDLLKTANIETSVFEGVPAEPPCGVIDKLRAAIKQNNSQLIIGMGGGSVMDAAKAGAILYASDQPTVWHLNNQKLPAEALPVIEIPTTAGTGSEATPTVVLTDESTKVKKSFRSFAIMPRAAILDPELTIACSPKVTAMSGMDAFVQAVEAYCSKFANNLSNALTEKAIVLIAQNLTEAYRDGSNLSARQAMLEGSLMAGMALANVRLGAVHGLAHPIGGKYGLPHGLVCAILLPVVLEFNKPALYEGAEDKYSRLCNLLMADPVEFSRSLLRELKLPQNLHDYKIPHADLDSLAEQALDSGSTRANPRECTKNDFLEMLEQII
jgi:alcohol dehydrogenase class IV